MNQTFIEPYADLAALQQSNRIDVNESRLETNWRGRVLRFGAGADADFDFNSPADVFERMFLKSYFRLIISKVNGDYFGKHDISPIFFSPGSSTAGFEDFKYAVDGVVKFVTRGAGTPWCPADPDFDYLKAFVSRDRGVPYQNIRLANKDEISIRDLFEMVKDRGVDAIVNQFYQEIQPSFGVNP
ncbi:MAG: hypothetical protein IPJ84_00170 [Bdellovibrionales bacterium]|nr:hypothetical protein [Bdellovibrionales bacterium]